MKAPIHNTKLYSGNNIPYPDLTWYESTPHWYRNSARGWLDSGITDRNCVEIYEGDLITVCGEETLTAKFNNAVFWLADNEVTLCHFDPSDLEVVGHIAEDINP